MRVICWLVLVALLLTGCTNDKIIEPKSNNNSGSTIDEKSILKTDKVDELIEKMSLNDKIEQMLVLDYSMVAYGNEEKGDVTKLADSTKEIIQKHNLGGIILFKDNVQGTKQTLELISDFQLAATKDNNKNQIPLFVCVDQEGGRITRLSTGTSMPGNMALGAANDYELTRESAQVIGKELKALGFNVDFSPVLDVNNNPSNPIIGVRSFSSNPDRVAKMGEAFIAGLHDQSIVSTLKHFPGHGDTGTDSHTGLPMINKSYDDIKQLELIPFKAGIDAGADMIMTAHIVYPQIETEKYMSKKSKEEITLPATLSKTILTDILRTDLGFEGIIVTDALNMGAITEHFDKKDVAKYAINAGVDILLMPLSLANGNESIDEYIGMVASLITSGEVSEDRINESVARILRLKQKMGLLDDNLSFELNDEKIENALNTVGSKENHDVEFKIAKEAITLVKGNELLPIDKNDNVLILNAYSNEKNNMEYAIELLKEKAILDDNFKYDIDYYENKNYSTLKSKISQASTIIITADTYSKAYFDNSNEKNGWQGRFIDTAIAEAHKQNKKVVLISCMLPYDVARYKNADVILCAYGEKSIQELPINYNGETPTFGQNMTAAIYKLFSGEDFKATLPVTIFNIDGNYNYTNEVLYN